MSLIIVDQPLQKMAILKFCVEWYREVFSRPVFHEDSKSGLRIGRRLVEHGEIVCEKSPILLRQIPILKKYTLVYYVFVRVGRLKYAGEGAHQRFARLHGCGFELAFVGGLGARDLPVAGLAFGFGFAFDFTDFADPTDFADFAAGGLLFGFGLRVGLRFDRRPGANTGSCVDAANATSRSSFAIVFVPR